MKKSLFLKCLLIAGVLSSLSFAADMSQKNEMTKKSGNKTVKMSCGAGKCGASMNNSMKKLPIQEEGTMNKKSGNKAVKMSCGAGKCGAGMSK